MAKQDLTVEIKAILKDYGEDVQEQMVKIIDEVSKEAQQRLKNTSPKRTGAYAKGWKRKRVRDRLATSFTVYNEPEGWKTHLLEYGHVIRNGKGTFGRTRGIPHIRPVDEWAAEEFEKRIKEEVSR